MQHAAVLDFTITKYAVDQIHGFIGFLDPQNLRKVTRIIFLAHVLGLWLSARVRDKLTCRGTTAATRVPRWRIGERPREVAQEGSTG